MNCQCDQKGGWCSRHHKMMTPRMAYLCANSERHAQVFERQSRETQKIIDSPKSMLDMARSISRSMAKWALIYFSTIRPNGRIDICKSCEAYDRGWCRVCGCLLWFKTRLPHEGCPLNRWSSESQPAVIYPLGKLTSDGPAAATSLQIITNPGSCGCKK